MRNARRAMLMAVGILTAVAAVVGALLLINADVGFDGCTVASPFGWMAPILLGSVLGGAAWALLAQRRAGDSGRADHDAVPCEACGREVLGQWRMCPYCGAMLDRASRPRPVTGTPESR